MSVGPYLARTQKVGFRALTEPDPPVHLIDGPNHSCAGGEIMGDYYELLGVSKGASPACIRSGFRRASLRSHPDKGGTAEQFAKIQTAYKTLINPELRHAYDATIGVRDDGSYGGTRLTSASYGFEYTRGGVHVEVHGQTQREPDGLSVGRRSGNDGARAGQRFDGMDSLTTEIEQRRGEMVARPTDKELIECVAEAHLDRAENHLTFGRLHHAAFDVHEVELLRPERAETKRRLWGLLKALEGSFQTDHDSLTLQSDSGDDA